jgi:hypothetical protein
MGRIGSYHLHAGELAAESEGWMADFFNYDSVKQAYDSMPKNPAERGQYVTIFVWWTIAHIVYYLAAATTAIILGRRLIQASFAAFKEARRERT